MALASIEVELQIRKTFQEQPCDPVEVQSQETKIPIDGHHHRFGARVVVGNETDDRDYGQHSKQNNVAHHKGQQVQYVGRMNKKVKSERHPLPFSAAPRHGRQDCNTSSFLAVQAEEPRYEAGSAYE